MDYNTTKTMVGNNNWQGRRDDIAGLCQPEGYKLTNSSFAFARFLILTMLMMTLGVTGAWGQEIIRSADNSLYWRAGTLNAGTYDGATAVDGVTDKSTYLGGEPGKVTVTITPGKDTWSKTVENGTYNGIEYQNYFNGSTAPKKGGTAITLDETSASGIPDEGSYIIVDVKVKGTVSLVYKAVTNQKYGLLSVKDGAIIDYHYIPAAAGNNTTSVEFLALPGVRYYFFGAGTNVAIRGLEFSCEYGKKWDFMNREIYPVDASANATGPGFGSSYGNHQNGTIRINGTDYAIGTDMFKGLAAQSGDSYIRTRLGGVSLTSQDYGLMTPNARWVSVLDVKAGDKIIITMNGETIDNVSGATTVSPSNENTYVKVYTYTVTADGNFCFHTSAQTYIKSIEVNYNIFPDYKERAFHFDVPAMTYTFGTVEDFTLPVPTNGTAVTDKTVTYAIAEGDAAAAITWVTPQTYKIKNTGTAIVRASNVTETTDLMLHVNALTAAAEKSNGNRTLTFTAPGLYENASETLDGLTLTFGDGTHPRVVVNKAGVGIGVKVLDGNGYYQKYPAGGITTTNEGTYVGTYYKLAATKSGTLTVKGYLDNAKLVNGADGSEVTATVTDGTLTADLSAGKTYYLYNEQNSETLKALLLHELTFEPLAEVPVTFANANPTITVALADGTFTNVATAGVAGASIVSYTSDNTSVAEVDGTGKVTLKAAGTAKITATSTAPAGYVAGTKSYTLTVKSTEGRKWLFNTSFSGSLAIPSSGWNAESSQRAGATWHYPNNDAAKGSSVDFSTYSGAVPETAGLKFDNNVNRGRITIAQDFGFSFTSETGFIIPASELSNGDIIQLQIRKHSSNDDISNMTWTNLKNVDGTDIDNSSLNLSGSFALKEFKVVDGSKDVKIMRGSTATWVYIGAIYIKHATPLLPTGAMTYNAGNSLSLVGGPSDAPTMTVTAGGSAISLDDNFTIDGSSWSSSDETVATVDSDGKVTPLKAGVTTITVKATAKDVTKYQDVWFSTVITVTDQVTSAEETIEIAKLFYAPSTDTQKTQGEEDHMDRVIPKFTLTMSGKDALRYNTEGKLVMKKYTQSNDDVSYGTIVIKPRYTGDTKIVFTGVELEVRGATNGTDQFTANGVSSGAMATADAKYAVELTGDAQKDELEIKYSTTSSDAETAGFQIVAIKLSYQTADGASFLTDVLDETKVSPSAMSFNNSTVNVPVGISFSNGLTFTLPVSEDATPATTTLFAPTGRVSYTSSNIGVATIGSDGTGQLIADGTSTITATLTFEDDDYFTGTLSDTYTVGRDALAAVAGIDVAQLLIADNVNTNTSNATHFTQRVIPRFSLDFAGGDGCKANQSGGTRFVELRNGTGSITITPRKKAEVAGTLKIAGYQLQYQDSPTATFTVMEENGGVTASTDVAVDGEWHATDCETLTLKHKTGDGVQLTGIRLIYRLVDGDGAVTDVEDAVVKDKTPLRLDVDMPVIELTEVGDVSSTVNVTTQSYGSADGYEAYRLDIMPTYATAGVATISGFTSGASKATGATVTATGVGSTSIKLGLAANDYFDVTPANIAVQVGGNRRQDGQLWDFTTMDTETFWGIKTTGTASGGYWNFMNSFNDPNYTNQSGRTDDEPYTNYYYFTQTNANAVPLNLDATTSISYTEGLSFIKNNANNNRIIGAWTNSDGVNTLLMLNTSMLVPVTNYQKVEITVSRTPISNAAFTLPNATASPTDLTIRSTSPITYVITPNVGVSSVQLNFASRATQVYQVRTYDARLNITPTLTYSTEPIANGQTLSVSNLTAIDEDGNTLTKEQLEAIYDVTYYTNSDLISVDPTTGRVTNTSGRIGSPDVYVSLTPKAGQYYFLGKASSYVNLRGVLEKNGNISIEASKGQTIRVRTANTGTATLTNCAESEHTFDTPDADGKYTWVTTASTTGTVTLTNTGDEDLEVVMFRAEQIVPEATFTYTNAIDDLYLFTDENQTPEVSIKVGEESVIDKYTLKYELTRNDGTATINETTGALSTGDDKGVVRATLTLTSNDPAYPDLELSKTLWIVDGVWDFRTIANATIGSVDGFSVSSSNGNRYDAYTDDWQLFVKRSDTMPLSELIGAQTKGSVSQYNGQRLTLFSSKLDKDHKGKIRVPVRENMVVTIGAYASDAMADFNLDGVTDEDGNPVTSLYTDDAREGISFIAAHDGYITIDNQNAALEFYLYYINVNADILLHDGDEVFVEAGEAFTPTVSNGKGSTFKYEITEGESLVDKDDEFGSNGKLTTKTDTKGNVTVKVTGLTGPLAGKEKEYTIYVVTMEPANSTISANLDNTTRSVVGEYQNDLSENVTITAAGYDYGEDEARKTEYESLIKKYKENLVFSMESCTEPGTDAVVSKSGGKWQFSSDGLGDVTIGVTLGTIHKTFTYVVSGVQFADMHPVMANDLEEFTLDLKSARGTIGEVKSQKITGVWGNLAPLTDSDISVTDKKVTITNIKAKSDWSDAWDGKSNPYKGVDPDIPSSKGGAIEVSTTVEFTPTDGTMSERTIVTVLTVAYSQHIWYFQDQIIEDSDDNHKNLTTLRAGMSDKVKNGESTYNTLRPVPQPSSTSDGISQPVKQNNTWAFERKFASNSSGAGYVYRYKPTLSGQNASILHPTAGMQIFSEGALAVVSTVTANENGFVRTTDDDGNITNTYNANGDNPYLESSGGKYYTTDTQNELLFKNGCRIVIPHVLPGQQIDCYWHRHDDDHGERLTMENLNDASGEYIDEIYKICLTKTTHAVDKEGSTAGCYSFIVADANGDGSPVDVEISSADGNYTRIHEIVLWNLPASDFADTQSTYESRQSELDAYHYLKLESGKEFEIPIDDSMVDLNVHTGGTPTYTYEQDETLGAKVTWSNWADTSLPEPDDKGYPIFHYTDGWGKFYVTLSNCTQDGKYISTWRNYTITVGKRPQQQYPYTWDFTKYFKNTKTEIAKNDRKETYIEVQVREDRTKTVTRATKTWDISTNDYNLSTVDYGGSRYESYHVDGAQLVSQALKAPLPETEGLGFGLNSDKVTKATLTLDMESGNVEAEGLKATDNSNVTWQSGYLSIGAGGKIIVPTPGEDFNDYYIYVMSDKAPAEVANAKTMVSGTPADEAKEEKDNHYDVDGTKQHKYHFTSDKANAELTFDAAAKVYLIAVTNIQKPMTPIGEAGSKTAWATEARGRAIDHTLTGHLTTNDVKAYAIIADISATPNPKFAADKSLTTVNIKDQRYVVPDHTGLVLKQTAGVADDNYTVPLFAPAVTTATDAAADFQNNLMRSPANPDVANEFVSETEDLTTDDGMSDALLDADNYGSTFTRYILAKRYMTWSKSGTQLNQPTSFQSREVAAFYRLHLYGGVDGLTEADGTTPLADVPEDDTAGELNTLGANKAYLVLPTSKLNDPLWTPGASQPAPPADFVGIQGISDWTDATGRQLDNHYYNLRGQLMGDDASRLPAGVYICNGRKVVVK